MNKSGFTLVEVLAAGAIFITVLACFNCLAKTSINFLLRAERQTRELYFVRSELERVRAVPFDGLDSARSGETEVSRIDGDLYLVRVGQVYTMRSKFQ